MLVPLDGSALADAVLSYAKELSGRLDLNPVFLHVCEPHKIESLPMQQAYIKHAAETCRLQSGKSLASRGEVVSGNPAEEILRYADGNDIDLILMGTHGHSGVKRLVFGSVTNRVMQAATMPVWLVRGCVPEDVVYDKLPKRKILVPLDGTNPTEAVLPYVEKLVKQRGAGLVDVVLLGVCEEPSVPSDYPEGGSQLNWYEHIMRMNDRVKESVGRCLTKLERRLADAGLKVHSEVRLGRSAEEIIGYANSDPFNLIVMAEDSRLSRRTNDNVVDKVLHGVSSPIFLVRPC